MAGKAADLSDIDIPRVQKGAAVPLLPTPAPPSALAPETSPPPLTAAKLSAKALAPEPSTAATFRLPVSLQERLREAAHQTRTTKTDIVEAALDAYLLSEGF